MKENRAGIEVLWFAESGYHPGAGLREHAHREYYQVYYILDGCGTFLVEHEAVEFERNMFFFVAPGISHGISRVQGELVKILEVKFTVPESGLLEETAKLPAVCRGTDGLRELLYQAFLESVQKDVYYEKLVSCLFSAWLYQVIRLYKNYNPISDKGDFRPRPTLLIKDYLRKHYAGDVSLDTLAQVTGYSKNYLCRVFRESTGTTIHNYLNEVRIGRAIDLLTGTDLDVAEVGRRCGYNSVFYFIKAFKKMLGVPPGVYRRSELTGADLVEGEVESVNSAMRTSDVRAALLNRREAGSS